jgi:hypothetical protein
MLHRGLLTIDGDPNPTDGLTFTDERGRRLQPAPPRPPRSPISSAAAADLGLPLPRWQHPPGERLDTRWINWN